MNLRRLLSFWRKTPETLPDHLQRGRLGEELARRYLKKNGLKFFMANFRSPRGEIDLVFRDGKFLVFVEVKTRSSEKWGHPAEAVDRRKRKRLRRAAYDYLRRLKSPDVPYRFDIVEVLLVNDTPPQINHWIDVMRQ